MAGGRIMKENISFLLVLVLFAVVPFQSYSMDFGLFLDDSTRLSSVEGASFFQKDKFSLWLNTERGKHLSFSMQGSYTYAIGHPYFFDLDHFYLDGMFPEAVGSSSLLNLNLGRFVFSDFSGNILDHNVDGLRLELNYPKVIFTLSAGYTGLLFKESSSVILSKADSSDSSKGDILFAPPRIVGAVELLFPELFARQDLVISCLAQQDFRGEDEIVAAGEVNEILGKGGKLHSQYYGLGLSGPLSSSFFYDSYFYLESGKTLSYTADSSSVTDYSYEYTLLLSYLFGGGLRYYMKGDHFSKIEFNFLFSSGDEDYESFIEGNTADNAGSFVPISRPDLGLVFSPQLGNIFSAELSYSTKPLAKKGYKGLENLQTILKTVAFFRPTTGPISEGGIDTSSDSLYLGTEIDTIINFRPFSDLGISLTAGLFIPNNGSGGAFLETDRELEALARLDFSFSF